MNDTFMKEKPVLPLLMSMALPMMLSMLVNSLYNIVDSYFIAKISEDAMTAISLVYPVQNFINAVAIGFGVGINAVIAYHLGADDEYSANLAATHSLILSVLHGILITAICIPIMPGFLGMFTSSGEVIALGVKYSRITFSFAVIISISLFYEKVFQAVGRMKVSMASMIVGCLSNIILDPLMIFGLGPFPKMGIAGAALATGIGQVLTVIFYLIVYKKRPIRVSVGRKYLVKDTKTDIKLYSIGIPVILSLSLASLLISALNAILAEYAQIYVLILGIYYKLQTFLYLPVNGMVQGMRPLIGYNYGAGEYKRVKQIYRAALCMSGIIMAIGTVLCLAVPGRLIGLFTQNQETIETGQSALRVISAGFIVSSVSVTSSGALEGLGKGTPSLVISLFRYTVLIIPLAFVLSRVFGPSGVWHAFWITEAITAVLSVFIYRKSVTV